MDIQSILLQEVESLQKQIGDIEQQMASIESLQWTLAGLYSEYEEFQNTLIRRLAEYEKTLGNSFSRVSVAESFLEDWDG